MRLGGTSEQELGRTNRNAGDSGGTGDSGMGETSRVTRVLELDETSGNTADSGSAGDIGTLGIISPYQSIKSYSKMSISSFYKLPDSIYISSMAVG